MGCLIANSRRYLSLQAEAAGSRMRNGQEECELNLSPRASTRLAAVVQRQPVPLPWPCVAVVPESPESQLCQRVAGGLSCQRKKRKFLRSVKALIICLWSPRFSHFGLSFLDHTWLVLWPPWYSCPKCKCSSPRQYFQRLTLNWNTKK